MTALALMLGAVAAALSFSNWRSSLFLCVLVGLLQDPLRKLAPNQPAYFVVLVGVVFGAAWLGALLGRGRWGPNAMQGWKQHMGTPFGLFLALVALQAFQSYARFGSAMMTGIGLMVWLAPVPAIVLAYQFALRRGMGGLRRWLVFYCGAAMVSLAGVYLQFAGVDWRALGEVGPGLTIYGGVEGGILKAFSGFFRSSELAAWHTAAIAAGVFMLFTTRRLTLGRLALAGAIVAVLLGLGLLTGRRKMLVEVMVFLSVYLVLVAWYRRGAARQAVLAALVGVLGYGAAVGLMDPDIINRKSADRQQETVARGERFKGYAVRGRSVVEDVPNRFANLGVAPIAWAVNGFGWFGAGLGTGSQTGTGNEIASEINRGAAEGGLGKITMELGVPGLLLMVWLLVAFVRFVSRALAFTTRASPPHARLAYGLVALLAAKVASFSVAAQAYSDLFVLLIMGWTVGFILAMPVLAARAQAAAQAPGPHPAPPLRRGQPAWAK